MRRSSLSDKASKRFIGVFFTLDDLSDVNPAVFSFFFIFIFSLSVHIHCEFVLFRALPASTALRGAVASSGCYHSRSYGLSSAYWPRSRRVLLPSVPGKSLWIQSIVDSNWILRIWDLGVWIRVLRNSSTLNLDSSSFYDCVMKAWLLMTNLTWFTVKALIFIFLF